MTKGDHRQGSKNPPKAQIGASGSVILDNPRKNSADGEKKLQRRRSNRQAKDTVHNASCSVGSSTLSTSVSVTKVLGDVLKDVSPGASSSDAVKIVEAMLYTLIGIRKGKRFSVKDYGRFIGSIRYTLNVLYEHVGKENREQDLFKYTVNCLMCRLTGSTLLPPKLDFPHRPLFSGFVKRMIDLAVLNEKATFIYSLQQAKLGFPPLCDERRDRAILKHQKIVCGLVPEPLPQDVRQEIWDTSESIFGVNVDVKETVAANGNLLSYRNRLPPPTKMNPSSSACLEMNRGAGGCRGLFPLFDPSIEGRKEGGLRALSSQLNQHRQLIYDIARSRTIQLAENEKWYTSLIPTSDGVVCGDFTKHDPRALDAKVVFLPEPGKFRAITEMSGFLTTVLQPAQGQMLESWKRSRYSTMGVDLTEKVNHVYSQSEKILEILPNDPLVMVSVDYESATDYLKPQATLAVFEPLYNLVDIGLCRFSLEPARLIYPLTMDENPTGEKKVKLMLQTSGQMMGHPLSFAALCTINLACFRVALKRWVNASSTEKVRMSRKRAKGLLWKLVIVNGDDMFYRAPQSFLPFFYGATRDAGLRISIGKNYQSTKFALINSQLFQLKSGILVRRGYLNLRLLRGLNPDRVSDTERATPQAIATAFNEMLEYCPWAAGCIPIAFSRFKRDNEQTKFQPNWFLPAHLGGFGLDQKWSNGNPATRIQRMVAARFVAEPGLVLYRAIQTKRKVEPWMKMIRRVFANYEMVPVERESSESVIHSVDPPSESEIETVLQRSLEKGEVSDDWLVRYMLMAKLSEPLPEVESKSARKLRKEKDSEKKEDPIYRIYNFGHIGGKHRLKPMSDDGLKKWNAVSYVAHGVPSCPPLNVILTKSRFTYKGVKVREPDDY